MDVQKALNVMFLSVFVTLKNLVSMNEIAYYNKVIYQKNFHFPHEL